MRKLIAALLVVAAGIGVGGTAFAGELGGSANGNGPKGTAHANSICVFSGLEDGEEDPTGPSGPGTTQNWGQIPKAIRDIIATQGEHPGDACNGHTGFLAGGGAEG